MGLVSNFPTVRSYDWGWSVVAVSKPTVSPKESSLSMGRF